MLSGTGVVLRWARDLARAYSRYDRARAGGDSGRLGERPA